MKNKISDLLTIMEKLRDPNLGCPWDCEQTFETIAPLTIEEAYELADSIERGDTENLKQEIGDLLFHVIFYAQIAKEADLFTFDDVVSSICKKMVSRHPHVFGNSKIDSSKDQIKAWEMIKADERRSVSANLKQESSALSDITNSLPALIYAQKLQTRAALNHFDWKLTSEVFEKIYEEINEVKEVINNGGSPAGLEEEIGDLLFTCVNLARKLDINAETALRKGNRKFKNRFRYIESRLAKNNQKFSSVGTTKLNYLWEEAKQHFKHPDQSQ